LTIRHPLENNHMTVRVGIVGSRFVATARRGCARCPGGDRRRAPEPEHIWEFHKRYGIPHAFADYKDMITSGLVDAVTVACPNDLHCEVTLAAAAAGKHVFVDKPLAMNLAECDEMIAACAKAGVILMYGENLCFAPKYVRAKQLADEGALGEVYYVRQLSATTGRTRSGSGTSSNRWWRADGHGLPLDRLLPLVFGNAPIESVSADVANFVHKDRTKGTTTPCNDALRRRRRAWIRRIGVAENSWARPAASTTGPRSTVRRARR
jgi:predicted dehydrogenase